MSRITPFSTKNLRRKRPLASSVLRVVLVRQFRFDYELELLFTKHAGPNGRTEGCMTLVCGHTGRPSSIYEQLFIC